MMPEINTGYWPIRPWYRKIPVATVIVFILLIGAWFFRWDTVASKTADAGVSKWKKDRWTGQTWYQQYGTYTWGGSSTPYFDETPLDGSRKQRSVATGGWLVLFIGNIGYAIYKLGAD